MRLRSILLGGLATTGLGMFAISAMSGSTERKIRSGIVPVPQPMQVARDADLWKLPDDFMPRAPVAGPEPTGKATETGPASVSADYPYWEGDPSGIWDRPAEYSDAG